MKKIVSTILLASLVFAVFSCSGEKDVQNDTSDVVSKPAVSEETSVSPSADDLPADLDLGGKTVTFLYREEKSGEFFAEAENADIVNDAIFKSMRSVEERLNVNIDVILRPGHFSEVRQEYMNHIKNIVASNESLYDWVDLMIGNAPVMMQSGIFKDLNKVKYLDFSKPYYLGGLIDNCLIDDKLFFTSGDASLGYLKCAFCLYFNQRLFDDYQLENPYELVDAGKWTMDKLMEISAAAASDLNSDGIYDINDNLGFVVHDNNHPWGFFESMGSSFYTRSADGGISFTYGSEHDIDVCDKVNKLFFGTIGSWFPDITNGLSTHMEKYNEISAKFASGNILIMTAELDDSVVQLRDMKDAYGILPFPKFDETQKDYISAARNTHNSFSMPITCSDPDAAGAVLEALSSSNHQNVLPAYFETALKVKYSRDDDSARMYDLIRDGMILDFGYTYNNAVSGGKAGDLFRQSYLKANSLSSNVAKQKSSLENTLEKYLSGLRENYPD